MDVIFFFLETKEHHQIGKRRFFSRFSLGRFNKGRFFNHGQGSIKVDY